MGNKADRVEENRIQGEIGRLVEVGFLRTEQSPEAAIIEDAIRIFGGTFRAFTDPRPASETPGQVMVECELKGL